MAEISRARALERSFKQRAARSRRTRWLVRSTLATAGMVLTLTLYLIPDAASRLVVWSAEPNVPAALRTAAPPTKAQGHTTPNATAPKGEGTEPSEN